MAKKPFHPQQTNFTFILDSLDVRCNLPIEIIPGHILRKANPAQIKRIREIIQDIKKIGIHPILAYEYRAIKQKSGGFAYQPLKYKKDWKYYIIQFKGFNQGVVDLGRVSNLSALGLRFGFTALGKHGLTFNPISLVNYFSHASFGHESKVVTGKQLKELKELYSNFKKVEKKYPEIERSINIFYSLLLLPRASDFYNLGLFSTIESLLTHAPDPKDPTDSLGRQIKSKIPLINHRVADPIDHKKHFGEISENKLWGKLYSYRSAVAHGGKVNFSSDFQILKNNNNIYDYLSLITKMLLRHAIIEPKLFSDLKQC